MQLQTAEEEMRRLSNQVRFIRAVRARQLDMTRKAAAIEAQLDLDGYDRLLSAKAVKKVRPPWNIAAGVYAATFHPARHRHTLCILCASLGRRVFVAARGPRTPHVCMDIKQRATSGRV
jgi:hypothetical protein